MTTSPSSIMLLTGDGREDVVEFTRCVHCGAHIPFKASIEGIVSGALRLGYCRKCDGVHCEQCAQCVPFEQQLDNVEAGRPRLASRPVSILVPWG